MTYSPCIFPPRINIKTEDYHVTIYDAPLSDEEDFKLGREGHGYDFSLRSSTVALMFRCRDCRKVKAIDSPKSATDKPGVFICGDCLPLIAGGQGRSARAVTDAGVILNYLLLALVALGLAGIVAVVGKVAAAVLFS